MLLPGESMQKRIALPTLLILFTTAAFAQMGESRPSPAASTTCDLGGGKTIKTNYSSPRMKGRKTVPAGSYTIFTVPAADKWTLIINKTTGEWGIPYKYESAELARVDMHVSKLPAPLENFTISYDKSPDGCTLRVDWET